MGKEKKIVLSNIYSFFYKEKRYLWTKGEKIHIAGAKRGEQNIFYRSLI